MTPPFRRVLVANRGEIAVRIIRACHELGMEAVAVYSDADATARHVWLADQAVRIGPPAPNESYLLIDAIVAAARETGCDAVHPGYGFLAERSAFARAVEEAGLTFVGPSSASIEALGDKLAARRTAREAGVAVVPGTLQPAQVDRPDAVAAIVAEATEIGFPLLVKAAAGGGGRGMRRVAAAGELPAALASGSREAADAFGDGSVYLEREVVPARHIEVQLLGDASGRVVAIGERDCSIQRRHQKLVEEAPAPGLTVEARRELHAMAVRVAAAAGLQNAATAEFLRSPDGTFYFLEVNTRLQVEHGVTELVSGLDIVREQFWLAAGRPLSVDAISAAERAAEPVGHAIEVRIAAEDPSREFVPTPGRVIHWEMPAGPGVRVDSAIEPGDRVPPEYDNLIAKIMVHAGDRSAAIRRLQRALDETEIGGLQTTLPFHRFVAGHEAFEAAGLSTGWVGEWWDGPAEFARAARLAQVAAGLDALGRGPARATSDSAPDTTGAIPAGSPWARSGRAAAVDHWPTADRRPRCRSPDSPRPLAGMSATELEAVTADRAAGHRIVDPRGVRVALAPSSARPEIRPVVIEPADGEVHGDVHGEVQGEGVLVDGVAEPIRLERFGAVHGLLTEGAGDDTRRSRVVLLPVGRPEGPASRVVRREVIVAGWRIEVAIESERHAAIRERARRGREETARGGPTDVRAIIPGRIVSVSIAPGDPVEAGQQLLAIEAMKMQNELRAPRDGIVTRVGVGVGQTIEVGDLLLVLE